MNSDTSISMFDMQSLIVVERIQDMNGAALGQLCKLCMDIR